MPIYTHITIGTNDLDKARDFYDKVLAPLGLKRLMNMDHGSFYGVDGPEFMVVKPRDGKPATVANGLTIGFRAPGKEAIDEFYKTALELGVRTAGRKREDLGSSVAEIPPATLVLPPSAGLAAGDLRTERHRPAAVSGTRRNDGPGTAGGQSQVRL